MLCPQSIMYYSFLYYYDSIGPKISINQPIKLVDDQEYKCNFEMFLLNWTVQAALWNIVSEW